MMFFHGLTSNAGPIRHKKVRCSEHLFTTACLLIIIDGSVEISNANRNESDNLDRQVCTNIFDHEKYQQQCTGKIQQDSSCQRKH